MKVLLDTNVVSEIRQAGANPHVLQRVQEIDPDDVYLSVITVGELVYGVKRIAPGKKRRDLETWLISLERKHGSRILPIDLEVAHTWGEITALSASRGRPLPAQDGLIAATAVRHGLHLMTRNVSDFQGCGVLLINPWDVP